MSEDHSDSPPETGKGSGDAADERVPFMQRVLDNPFLLLFLGVAVPALLYIIWGLMEVAMIPLAQ
jgi:hypothetical protein